MAKKQEYVDFEPLKIWAKTHLMEKSKMRSMILEEKKSVPRQEMIVKLDMYNRMYAQETKR